MFIPRFSIRWLLGLTTFSAFVSFILSYSVRGYAWAIGMVAGLWTLVATFIFFAAAFLAAWLVAQWQDNWQSWRAHSTGIEEEALGESQAKLASLQPVDLPPPISG